jgi:hypothetical protein
MGRAHARPLAPTHEDSSRTVENEVHENSSSIKIIIVMRRKRLKNLTGARERNTSPCFLEFCGIAGFGGVFAKHWNQRNAPDTLAFAFAILI